MPLAINDNGADDGEYIQHLSKYLQKKKQDKNDSVIPTEVDASPTSRCFGDRATGI